MALHCACTLIFTVKRNTYLGMIGSGKSVLYSKDLYQLIIQFILELGSLISKCNIHIPWREYQQLQVHTLTEEQQHQPIRCSSHSVWECICSHSVTQVVAQKVNPNMIPWGLNRNGMQLWSSGHQFLVGLLTSLTPSNLSKDSKNAAVKILCECVVTLSS